MSVKLDEALQEKRDAEMLVKEAERKAQTLIEAANSEAEKLVAAANNERDKSQDEAKQLREQIKELTIDEAKRELEKAESERARDQLSETQSKIADLNTLLTQVQTQNESLTIEKDRNYSELQEAKVQANKAMQLQTQLLTKEGQLGEVNSKLSQAEKQVESLNRTITLLEPKKS
jgi:chromosome segregation ATPase